MVLGEDWSWRTLRKAEFWTAATARDVCWIRWFATFGSMAMGRADQKGAEVGTSMENAARTSEESSASTFSTRAHRRRQRPRNSLGTRLPRKFPTDSRVLGLGSETRVRSWLDRITLGPQRRTSVLDTDDAKYVAATRSVAVWFVALAVLTKCCRRRKSRSRGLSPATQQRSRPCQLVSYTALDMTELISNYTQV